MSKRTQLALCIELAGATAGAPARVELIPAGPAVVGRDGRTWLFDDAAAASVLAAFGARGIALPIDTLLVPTSLEGTARKLLVKDENGGNEWAGSATLAVRGYPLPQSPLQFRVDINTSAAKGYFTGHAKVRSKPEFSALVDAVRDGEYENRDEDLLREMYERFDGFGDSDGFAELLTGKASAYLYPAATAAYFEQFGEARRENSAKRRSR